MEIMCNGVRSQVGSEAMGGWIFMFEKGFCTWFGKTLIREWCLYKNSCCGAGWEVKVQESQMSVNSFKTVVGGKPLFSSSVQVCAFAHEEAKFKSQKIPCYSFGQEFCSIAEAVKKEQSWRSSPEVQSVSIRRVFPVCIWGNEEC